MRRPQRDPIWRRLVSPELLFLFGTLQALVPYYGWHGWGPNRSYTYTISYIPAVFWAAGYVAFWLGAKLAGRRRAPTPIRLRYGTAWIATLTRLLVIFILLQCVALVRVYGGVPMLTFLSGEVINVDAAARQNSFVGQLALFLSSQLMLDGLVVLLIVAFFISNRRYRLLMLISLVTLLMAGMFAGKRQSVAIAVIFVATASCLYFGHPLRPLLRYLGIRRPRWWARAMMVALPIAMVAFLGWVVSLRTGEKVTGGGQVGLYLQLGLLNMEVQAEAAGYGPKRFAPERLLQYYLPDRVTRMIPTFWTDMPPRAETSAPAGFYGDLHWNVGLPGALLFALFVGWLAKRFYLRAPSSPWHLLVYSLMSWTLITPFLYNHFLASNFLLYPAIGFAILVRLTGVSAQRPARARRPALYRANSVSTSLRSSTSGNSLM